MSEIMRPLVSIIIASYNHAAYVEEAIRSVLNQTYQNIQLIVIDDASPDDSAQRISVLQKEGHFLFLQNERNIGLQRSLTRAIQEVKGDYLGWFASDDILIENKIERQIQFILERGIDGVYSTCYLLLPDKSRVVIDLSGVDQMFLHGSYLNHIYVCDTYGALFQSGLFSSKALRELQYIRDSFWSDDWAIAIKLMEKYRIGFLNEPLVLYRQHENNTHKKIWTTLPGRIQVISQLTPMNLRLTGLSNVIGSHAEILYSEGKSKLASRLLLASLIMDFSLSKLMRYLTTINFPPLRVFRTGIGLLAAVRNKMTSVWKN